MSILGDNNNLRDELRESGTLAAPVNIANVIVLGARHGVGLL